MARKNFTALKVGTVVNHELQRALQPYYRDGQKSVDFKRWTGPVASDMPVSVPVNGEFITISRSDFPEVYVWAAEGNVFWWSSVEKVLLPKNMSWMFSATPFKSIDLSGMDGSEVEHMSHAFHSCTDLETLDMSFTPPSVAVKVVSTFNGCNRLKSVVCPGWDLDTLMDVLELPEIVSVAT